MLLSSKGVYSHFSRKEIGSKGYIQNISLLEILLYNRNCTCEEDTALIAVCIVKEYDSLDDPCLQEGYK